MIQHTRCQCRPAVKKLRKQDLFYLEIGASRNLEVLYLQLTFLQGLTRYIKPHEDKWDFLDLELQLTVFQNSSIWIRRLLLIFTLHIYQIFLIMSYCWQAVEYREKNHKSLRVDFDITTLVYESFFRPTLSWLFVRH